MAKWVVPVELETGVPLGIAPSERGLPPAGLIGLDADWHHLIHPSDRKELVSVSGLALRHTRVEWMNKDEHLTLHHYTDGYMANEWDIPHTPHEKFGMAVLLLARYLPRDFIKVERRGLSYVRLEDYQRQKMWDEGILRIGHEGTVHKLIWQQIESQNLEDVVKERDIEQFLTTQDDLERLQLGNKLLDIAAEMATQDIKPIYRAVRKERLIPVTAPTQAHRFVTDDPVMFGTPNRKRRARKALHKRLAEQHNQKLADTG